MDTKLKEPSIEDVNRAQDLVNTYTYFSVYDGITSRLGNFYSETLAKMTGPEIFNRRIFNPLYNNTIDKVIKNALESAKAGNELNFNILAQTVKDQITAELEACNYAPIQYQKNQMDKNIAGYKNFNQ